MASPLPTFASLVSSEACSLSPVSVVVKRLEWCASSRSILLFMSGRKKPVVCRTAGFSREAVSALVAELRAARDSNCPVQLLVRRGWSGRDWFCGVERASEGACRAADLILSESLGIPNERWDERIRANCFKIWQYEKLEQLAREATQH